MDSRIKGHQNDFASFVMGIQCGDANRILSDELAEVIAAVEETGKDGSLTVKFKIKKEGKMSASATCESTAKIPKESMLPQIMYFVDGVPGTLTDKDPMQLPLRGFVSPFAVASEDSDE